MNSNEPTPESSNATRNDSNSDDPGATNPNSRTVPPENRNPQDENSIFLRFRHRQNDNLGSFSRNQPGEARYQNNLANGVKVNNHLNHYITTSAINTMMPREAAVLSFSLQDDEELVIEENYFNVRNPSNSRNNNNNDRPAPNP